MSNRHVRELQQVYLNIFKDIEYAYPALGRELSRDIYRLNHAVDARGINVFVVDLPAVGKHLDRCLASGKYIPSGLPLTKRYSNGVVIPKFLRGLYLLVFDSLGNLKENADELAIFFLRQVLLCAKKASLNCPSGSVRREIDEFYHVDNSLPEPDRFWSDEVPTSEAASEAYKGFMMSGPLRSRIDGLPYPRQAVLSTLLAALDFVSGVVTATLGPYSPEDWRFKHGPGAISEVIGPTNKYCWRNWSNRLESAYPIARYGFHSYSSWAGHINGDSVIGSEDPASRLIAVPKTYTRPRLIAAEPSEHQWCQQNCWDYFCSRTKASWINDFIRFTDQSLNQELCLRGSRDGTLATVDLSAASDRVTCHAVGQMFRSNPRLLLALQASRTRFVDQKLSPNVPTRIALRKFSTMGSANTFPVESLIFLTVSIASVLVQRQMPLTVESIRSLSGSVAVFGDDIVIPVDSRGLLFEALELLEFKVNEAKSFWTGRFRESCGVDAYKGVNVTPVYWRRFCNGRPESVASVVETANNFYKKFMLHTASYLASTIPKGCKVPMVSDGSGVFGLISRTRLDLSGLTVRINPSLHRGEALVRVLSGTQAKSATNDDSALLQFFTELPSPHTKWVHGVAQRPKLKLRLRWVPLDDISVREPF